MDQTKQLKGMKAFTVILFGQFFSILGSAMTGFAMTIWAYEKTGRATDLAMVGFFWMLPMIIVSPFVGAIVDRYSRKLLMIIADLSAVAVTIFYLLILTFGELEIWHLYLGVGIISIFNTMQWPAFSAAMTLMIPKEHYARAHSLLSISGPGSQIVAPILAGALLPFIGMGGILMVDIVTAALAIISLFFIFIPDPEKKEADELAEKPSFFKESMEGFHYILERPSLIWLQTMFAVGNFFGQMTQGALFAPLVLSHTNNNELLFGSVQTIAAVGGLAGGLIIGAWGGFKRRIRGVLLGWALFFVGIVIMGLGRGVPAWMGVPFWGGGMLLTAFAATLVNSSNQAIWQSKVAPDMQGRVFSIRRMIAWIVNPLAILAAGPLADYVMEPAMAAGGALREPFSWLVGTEPGSGMSLLFIICAVIGIFSVGLFFNIPHIRNVEDILPDHDHEVETLA